ncbi:MAG TPA: NAD-dependent epimerase/dehydratase family protein [Gemmataceae bacterium]|jgi:nucleoside-diphosphate-sugar epimerase|nr:NAD-dependent epimerase/dehydratase family protein [Gemmataceae bacterium]
MILVTGATGHLGANLVRRLLDDGKAVRALLRPQSDAQALAGLDVELAPGDLRDPAVCASVVRSCTAVYHCAAKVSTTQGNSQHRREIFACNVLGTRNLLHAALSAGVARVVVTGSFSAVGHDPARPSDESVPFDPFAPSTPYGQSKAAVEHECLKAFADGLPVVVATSCAILGPNDFKPSRMGQLLLDFAQGRLKAYVPGGFEFVAARDIVQGHLLAMTKGRPGQKYIFSTQFLTVDELLSIYEQVTGRNRPKLRLPGSLMSGLASIGDLFLNRLRPEAPRRFTAAAVRFLRMRRQADCSKAKRELGYQPSSIGEAVQEAYEFFCRRGQIETPRKAFSMLPANSEPLNPSRLGARP